MDYKIKDFDHDSVQHCAALRVEIANKYGAESFWLAESHFLDGEEVTTQERKEQKGKVKVSKGLIKIGYKDWQRLDIRLTKIGYKIDKDWIKILIKIGYKIDKDWI